MVDQRIENAVIAVHRVFKDGGNGGNLQMMVDDWSLTDEILTACRKVVNERIKKERPRNGGSHHYLLAEEDCLNSMENLTERERITAMAAYNGFISI